MNLNGLSQRERAFLIKHIRKLPIDVLTPDLPFLAAAKVNYYLKNPPQSPSDRFQVRW